MWIPKYREFKEFAEYVSSEYKLRTSQGQESHQVVKDIAKQNNKTVTSIYRYLKSTGTHLVGLDAIRKRKEQKNK